MTLSTSHVFTLTVDIAEPVDAGSIPTGHRRIIPITGGRVDGPELHGDVLPGGADWNTAAPDGTIHVWARYDFRTSDGGIVGVVNEGSHTPDGPLDPGSAGPSSVAIVTKPTFEASAGAPAWLNTDTFAGILRPLTPTQVSIEVYRLHPKP